MRHNLLVVPVRRTGEFPWYEVPSEFLDVGFDRYDAILEFAGFREGVGGSWRLSMNPDVYDHDDEAYEIGGPPEAVASVTQEAIAYLDQHHR